MRFKEWLNETGTTTGDVAGYARIAIPLVRRGNIFDDILKSNKDIEKEEKKIKKQPQLSC